MILRRGRNSAKKKAISKNKCFNCHKIVYFGKDCTTLDICPLKKKANKATGQQHYQKRNRVQIVAADDNSDIEPEPFKPSKAHMAKEKFKL